MKRFSPLYIILLLVALTGCNADVFLDGPDIPEYQSVTIEGDGGGATFKIPTKGLESVSLDLMSSEQVYCHYFNRSGEEIAAESPVWDVHKIVLENQFTKLECVLNGSELSVHSVCSTRQSNVERTIRLEYSYGARFIDVTILPGKPIQFAGINYTTNLSTDSRAQVHSRLKTFNNNGPIPQKLTVYPYLNEPASVLVEPRQSASWLNSKQFTMEVPLYSNGQWVMEQMDNLTIGSRYPYPVAEWDIQVEIEVPANSRIMVFTDVIYTGAKIEGQMVFRNEVLDLTFSEEVTVKSLYPTAYEIRSELAE
ncbi:MAG: hypothetical protein HDT04_02360 [Bacteroidales bacterium]|nr:hypothetical protein [Bacteroidales bacterium]